MGAGDNLRKENEDVEDDATEDKLDHGVFISKDGYLIIAVYIDDLLIPSFDNL